MSTENGFKSWAIVELFGHTKLAGEVSDGAIGGCSFVRIDIPEVGQNAAHTKFLGQGSIYAITPVSREIAVKMAEKLNAKPVQVYDILPPRQGQLGYEDPEEFCDDED